MRVAAVIAFCTLLALPGQVAAQGLEPEDPTALRGFPQASVGRGISVPPRVMLQGVPAPGNQWRTSTCVAWAVAYAAGSYFHRAQLGHANAALSPAFAYAIGNGDARCLATSRVSKMLDTLRDIGALPLSDYAYDPGWCGRVPTEAERRRAAIFRIPGWAVVPALNPGAAKLQLAAGRVVIFSMGVGSAFDAHRGKQVFDVLETGPDFYGHAMVAIGYDDTMQAFRIQNSAGTGWGDGGQAWLSYRLWQERAVTAYVIMDLPSPAQAPVVSASPGSPQIDTAVLERLKTAMPAKFVLKQASLEEVLRKYLAEKTHRALALSFSEGGTWRQGDGNDPQSTRQMVLEKCQMFYGRPCVLFAEDDQVQLPLPGRDWEPQDMPRVTYSGLYDPEQVPGVSNDPRGSPVTVAYGRAPTPKAMAVHPWGSIFTATAGPSQPEAEAEALRRCNADPARQGRDGPCYLYAAGSRVVLVQRRTQPLTP